MSDHPLRRFMNLIEGPHADALAALPAPAPGFIRVYHAQQHSIPGTLTKREIRTFSSMGTWFATDPGMVHFLYGDHARAYDIPEGHYLEPEDDYIVSALGHCYPLIEKHFGEDDADHLREYPWSRSADRRYKDLDARLRDENLYIPSKTRFPMVDESRALYRSMGIVKKAIKSPAYCRDFRDMIVGARYNGFCWKNTNFDNSLRPMNVYLVFHDEDIHPVSEVLPVPDDAAENKKQATYMHGIIRGLR